MWHIKNVSHLKFETPKQPLIGTIAASDAAYSWIGGYRVRCESVARPPNAEHQTHKGIARQAAMKRALSCTPKCLVHL